MARWRLDFRYLAKKRGRRVKRGVRARLALVIRGHSDAEHKSRVAFALEAEEWCSLDDTFTRVKGQDLTVRGLCGRLETWDGDITLGSVVPMRLVPSQVAWLPRTRFASTVRQAWHAHVSEHARRRKARQALHIVRRELGKRHEIDRNFVRLLLDAIGARAEIVTNAYNDLMALQGTPVTAAIAPLVARRVREIETLLDEFAKEEIR